MIKIGIAGSLSSGKSTVCKFISKKKYSNLIGHGQVNELYKNKKFINVLCKKMKIPISKNIKKVIKKIIQNDKKKISVLEKIIHPEVRKKMFNFIKKNKNKNIILEIPLLIEGNLSSLFDKIIFVDASKSIRIKRYVKRGGTKKMFNFLDKRQLSPRKKIKFCHHVVKNNQNLEKLKNSVKYLDI